MYQKNCMAGDICRIIVMGAATVIDMLFGKADGILATLIVFMTLDYLTGVLSAAMSKKLSSKIGFKGFLNKVGILCIISLTAILDRNLFNSTTLRNAAAFHYISNEGISIIENLAKMGIPIPQKLKEVLYEIRDEKDNEH